MSQKAVSTLHELETWLIEQNIDLSNWGRGSAKSVCDLLREITTGDSKIISNPARRQVEVAVVVIQDGDKYLIEHEQVMSDSRIRVRNWPPSEKLQQNEPVLDAVKRCLREELGVNHSQIGMIRILSTPTTERKPSPSYPGLETEYTLHLAYANVRGLPQKSFETHELSHSGSGTVNLHRWVWREMPPQIRALI